MNIEKNYKHISIFKKTKGKLFPFFLPNLFMSDWI